jgi:hypothetical protein
VVVVETVLLVVVVVFVAVVFVGVTVVVAEAVVADVFVADVAVAAPVVAGRLAGSSQPMRPATRPNVNRLNSKVRIVLPFPGYPVGSEMDLPTTTVGDWVTIVTHRRALARKFVRGVVLQRWP